MLNRGNIGMSFSDSNNIRETPIKNSEDYTVMELFYYIWILPDNISELIDY